MLQPREDHSSINRERCSIPFSFPEKIGNTWLAHARGRCINVSEGLITLRIQHCGSCDEGGEKWPTIYLVEHIWWCIIWWLAGEDWVRIHCNDVPRMVQPLSAGCAKDDSIEFIKWRSWGVPCAILSWGVTERLNGEILFCDYVRFLSAQRNHLVCAEDFYLS